MADVPRPDEPVGGGRALIRSIGNGATYTSFLAWARGLFLSVGFGLLEKGDMLHRLVAFQLR